MVLRFLRKASQSQNSERFSPILSAIARTFSSQSTPPSFGIAFDITGVVLRGETPIGDSPQALRRLYDDSGVLKVPYIFLTNGGGFRESKRALELSELLGVNILPSQVVQGHSPFKHLVGRFKKDLVIAVGKGEPAAVMSEYGFKNVLSIDDYASCFDNIDPLLPYKKWTTKQFARQSSNAKKLKLKEKICSQRVAAVFIVSDSVDWSRDIQVLCDILITGGLPGSEFDFGHQPALYFAHEDLTYQAAFPLERFGMGAFKIALQSVFNRIHPYGLKYAMFGKPNPSVFKYAETLLDQLGSSLHRNVADHTNADSNHFKRLYMIGDNPSVDICGAREAGLPWFSILTRTGVFKGNENHHKYPADLVVDTVKEAVDCILFAERAS